MLKTNKNQGLTQKGFTIIEVLIVLAIAGLILLIVFLAVPALQRSSRNTAVKNDAQNALGGVAEFQNANNGILPDAITADPNGSDPGKVTYTKTGKATTSIMIQGTTSVHAVKAAPNKSATPQLGHIEISLGYRCDLTASSRAISAVFWVETTGDPAAQCVDS